MNQVSRRYVLLVGGGAVAALAGCSGGGSGEGDGTTTVPTEDGDTQPSTLAIENSVLCAEQPTGYQNYTEQPEGTYDPGDVVWVYFEPTSVGTEPAGEGEIRFEYDLTWTVTAPDGEELGTMNESVSRTLADSADLSTVFLAVNFSPSMEFEEGTHTMEIEVTDTIADNTATETVEFSVDPGLEYTSGEFGIETFVFTEDEARGYDDYTPNPDAEYGPTETVWYYYEIDGFAYEETSNELRADLQILETLTGPEGEIWSQADIPLSNTFDTSVDLDTYYVTDRLSPSDEWIAGEYTLRLEVTDRHTDESVTETYTFTVPE
ncbi:MAG: hypothetical protein V5A45_14430 [Haloarculaceae archaeon]